MALFTAHLVAIAGSLSGHIFLSSWLLAWCSFLAAFGVKSVQPLPPDGGNGLEQLFAAVSLAPRDVFGVMLGSGGRFTCLEMARCLLGAFLCTFLVSTSDGRKFDDLAQVEWQQMALSFARLVAVAGSLSGQIFLSRWLVVWCSFLAAFGVKSVQPFFPDGANGVEQLFAAILLARRDGFGLLLGFDE